MVALAVTADIHLILQLGALGSRGDLAVLHGVAGSLQEAQGGLLGGGVLVLGAHALGVDGLAVDVHGVSHLVAVVSDLRSGPGGAGDGVVDDGSGLAVVGVDALVAIDGDDGAQGLAQILGGVGIGIIAHLHVVGVDAHIAVAQEVVQAGGDDGAVQAVVAAVDVGHLVGHVGGVAGLSNVQGTGLDTGDHVGLGGLHVVEVLDLGGAQIVAVIGLVVHHAVGVLDELVGAGAHGAAGLGLHTGQIALGEAEGIILIIVQGLIAVVVHGGNGQSQLIDHGSVDLSGGNPHGVVAGTLDTGNVGSGLTGSNTNGVSRIQVAPQGTAGHLGIGSSLIVAIILGYDIGPIVGQGRIGTAHHIIGVAHEIGEAGQFFLVNRIARLVHSGVAILILSLDIGISKLGRAEAPHGHAEYHLQALVGLQFVGGAAQSGFSISVGVVGQAVIHDGLGKALAGSSQALSPESGLGGLIPVGEVGVILTGGQQQLVQGIHTGAVLLQALDGQGVHGGVTIIGRIQVDVDAEDHIVDVGGLTVGEDDVVPHGHIVSNSTVFILSDDDIGGTIVGVVRAVVGAGLALDTVKDRVAHTVNGQQQHLGQADDLVIGVAQVEEGRELTLQALLNGNHQRGGVGLPTLGVVGVVGAVIGRVVVAAAAGQHANAHHQCQKQCKCFFASLHGLHSSSKF